MSNFFHHFYLHVSKMSGNAVELGIEINKEAKSVSLASFSKVPETFSTHGIRLSLNKHCSLR